MYKNEKMICFSRPDEMAEFVSAASRCDFDIDVKYNRTVLDAKSLIAIMGIGLRRNCTVCYMGNDENFKNLIDKLAVA